MATHEQPAEGAGPGRLLMRAGRDVVDGRRIPDFMKVQLVEVGSR
ncbi:hypothetical protein [Streptomyces sp. NPDC057287]